MTVENSKSAGTAPPEYKEAVREYKIHEAQRWHREVNTIRQVPLEHSDPFLSGMIKNDPENSVHAYHERDLRDAYNYRTEMIEMFETRHIDDRLETVIWAGLDFALEAMKYEHATVSGIVVGTMRAMLWSQQSFHTYFRGPSRPYPRSVKDIQAHIEAEKIESVSLGYLELELADAIELEAIALSSSSE